MKKLFLYLTIFLTLIFISSFVITNRIFKERMKNHTNTPTDAEKVTDDTTENEKQDIKNANTENTIEELSKELEITETIAKDNNNVYIVCIKDNQIVVCKNTVDEIYEFTGINADIIKACHGEIYQALKEGIRYDSIEKMFDFLESIAS